MLNERPRLLRDIEQQPVSLRRSLHHHGTSGRAALQAAAQLIAGAKRCVIVGIGASLNASMPLESLLCASGRDAMLVEAGEWLHFRAHIPEGAVFVLVSRSGDSIEIARSMEMLAGRAPVIGVTNVVQSRLGRSADVVIDLHSLTDEMVAIQTYSATLAALHLLGMAALGRIDHAFAELARVESTLTELIREQVEGLSDWDGFLGGDACLYALGRGPSFGSATQSALLFHEVAKVAAVGMPVSSFRHGPIEVVDPRFRALVLAPAGATQPLNVALAADIRRFGGHVRLIGPPSESVAALPWISTSVIDAGLAPLLEAVPLQCAALRLAQLRGIRPGSFRFTPQVALREDSLGS